MTAQQTMEPSFRPAIFVTGASRSGTTLLSFILRNHPRVFGLRELHYFGDMHDPRDRDAHEGARKRAEDRLISGIARLYARQEYGICALRRPDPHHRARARGLLQKIPPHQRTATGVFAAAIHELSEEQGKSIPCEQTPRNIFYANALLAAFPAAHIVHMVRDPRAVMASQKKRWRRRALTADPLAHHPYHALREWINYHPYTMASLWNRATREAKRLANHPRFHLLRFEDLIRMPEETVSHLCAGIGLTFQPDMLDVPQVNSSHQSSRGGARHGIYQDAMENWRSHLNAQEIRITERICGNLMRVHGYAAEAGDHHRDAGELRYMFSYMMHLAGVLAINPRRAWIQLRAVLPSARRAASLATE